MSRGTIWWDFDGTLISRPAMFAEAASRVVRSVAPDGECPDAALLRAMDSGMPWHRSDGAHPELATAEQWWECVSRRCVEVFLELGLPQVATSSALEAIRRDIQAPARYHLFDDVEPALRRLREAARTYSIPNAPIWIIGDNLTADCLAVAPFGVSAILVRTRVEPPPYERQAEDRQPQRGAASGIAARTA